MRIVLSCCLLLASCGSNHPVTSDAPNADAPRADTANADTANVDTANASDAQPSGTSTSHVLFLQFEGQAVAPGNDNPAANTSSIPTGAVTLAAFETGVSTRAADIQTIVTDLTTALTPYGLAVVTTRPATGKYDMVIVTSDSAARVGLPNGTAGSVPITCDAAQPPTLGFVFVAGQSLHTMAANSLAMIAQQHTIPQARRRLHVLRRRGVRV